MYSRAAVTRQQRTFLPKTNSFLGARSGIYETERRLLYVACKRAREHLLLTGVAPTSEYLADFNSDLA
jgi:ATP-dependent exoDNAse (exonuclease V) beta subunit